MGMRKYDSSDSVLAAIFTRARVDCCDPLTGGEANCLSDSGEGEVALEEVG